jgi:hypothetical protein
VNWTLWVKEKYLSTTHEFIFIFQTKLNKKKKIWINATRVFFKDYNCFVSFFFSHSSRCRSESDGAVNPDFCRNVKIKQKKNTRHPLHNVCNTFFLFLTKRKIKLIRHNLFKKTIFVGEIFLCLSPVDRRQVEEFVFSRLHHHKIYFSLKTKTKRDKQFFFWHKSKEKKINFLFVPGRDFFFSNHIFQSLSNDGNKFFFFGFSNCLKR